MVWDIWDEIERMHEEIDSMTNKFFGRERNLLGYRKETNLPAKYSRTPHSEIKETDNKIFARLELPGIDKKDIELNITENSIEVKAEKKQKQEIKKDNEYRYFEQSGSFYRKMPLPAEVEAEKAVAAYENGVLRIEVPKKDGSKKTKRIEIK